jgi:hypothetical protein
MYTTDHNVSTPLGDVMMKIKEVHDDKLDLDVKLANKSQLFDFMATVMPDFDSERVRESDVRKLINWYRILLTNLPESFVASLEAESTEEEKIAE